MSLIVSLIVMAILAVTIKKPLRSFPWLFYLLAAAVSIAGFYLTLNSYPNSAVRAFAFAVQKGQLGFSLFAVVMFIGVFDINSAVRKYFNPVRSNLSIIAALLITGHFALYLRNQLVLTGSLLSPGLSNTVSMVLALILVILLIVLTVTSFNAVKRKMKPAVWKSLQKLAYVFFGLTYLHLLSHLLAPALGGSITALTNVVVYTMLFVAYTALRVRKSLGSKKVAAKPLESFESKA